MSRATAAVLGAVSLLLAMGSAPAQAGTAAKRNKWVPMTIQKVSVIRGSYVVMLKQVGGSTIVPIWIGAREAQAIQMGLKSLSPPRPLTHNLLVAVLKKLKANVHRLEVVRLKNRVFIGRLVLRDRRKKKHSIDARPSDLCVLASMKKLTVYVAWSVVQKMGGTPPKPRRSGGSSI